MPFAKVAYLFSVPALVLEENNMKVVIKVINLKRAPLPPIETVLYFVLQVLGDYMLVVLQWPF